MTYSHCQACPDAVAAWSLSDTARAAVPEASLLCVKHLKELFAKRKQAAAMAERNLNRRYCQSIWCNREIYLQTPGRVHCSWCEHGQPWTVAKPYGPGDPRPPADWYWRQPCHAEDCQAKETYLLKDGLTVACPKHGAEAAKDTQHD